MANTEVVSGTNETTIRMLREDHRRILALFHLYLAMAADSRRSTVDQILGLLEEHFQREEGFLSSSAPQGGGQACRIVEQVLIEHDELRAMIEELRRSESDDDQALDEFFEDMMHTVRLHFLTEERDFFPHVPAASG
ncbi:MAG: hemerythrin domain-containing protein [Nitrospira sp.]|nr:hemerythrin domain-containing protein [Nitrospira sp.]